MKEVHFLVVARRWQTDVHDPITGRNGSKADIAKDLVIVQIKGDPGYEKDEGGSSSGGGLSSVN